MRSTVNNHIDLRTGLADVIGLDWLRMFSSKELSTLVAGAEHEINVSDLQVSHLSLLENEGSNWL